MIAGLTTWEFETLGAPPTPEHRKRRNVVDSHRERAAVDALGARFQNRSVRTFLSFAFAHDGARYASSWRAPDLTRCQGPRPGSPGVGAFGHRPGALAYKALTEQSKRPRETR